MRSYTCYDSLLSNYCFCLQISGMKVVAVPEEFLYDSSLRKAMGCCYRFLSLVGLSLLSLLHVTVTFS